MLFFLPIKFFTCAFVSIILVYTTVAYIRMKTLMVKQDEKIMSNNF